VKLEDHEQQMAELQEAHAQELTQQREYAAAQVRRRGGKTPSRDYQKRDLAAGGPGESNIANVRVALAA
jgi:hypothetical protein